MSEDFGSYRLLERIGGGALGEVFRAQGPNSEIVALKRLALAHRHNLELAAVMLREADIARKMQHERLLGALDSGMVGDWPFLCQRLARDGSLQTRFTPSLPRPLLHDIASDLFDAVQAVHERGYLHCDLSPGNVLFDEGRALLADFSAASLLGRRQAQPQGTYAFMSPEQVKGEVLQTASDVFSLATLLWLCATGERIFQRPAAHLCFMAVVEDSPPPMPTELGELEKVLRAALAKRPGQRPGMGELREGVTHALSPLHQP